MGVNSLYTFVVLLMFVCVVDAGKVSETHRKHPVTLLLLQQRVCGAPFGYLELVLMTVGLIKRRLLSWKHKNHPAVRGSGRCIISKRTTEIKIDSKQTAGNDSACWRVNIFLLLFDNTSPRSHALIALPAVTF